MLKFDDILTMANVGLMKATSHTLSVQGAYTLTRLKSEVDRLLKEWGNHFEALLKEAGIEDTNAFDERQAVLKDKKRTKDEEKEFKENNEKLARLIGLRKALNNDDVQINCKPMSFDDWYHLKEENKEIKVPITFGQGKENEYRELFELIEIASEGVLWKAPEE